MGSMGYSDRYWVGEVLAEHGIVCSENVTNQVSIYLKLLEKWNKKVNLTGLKNPKEMLVQLFAESFFAGRVLKKNDTPIVDVGSGAGFPGMALKILNPHWRFYLLEPRQKRASFLAFVKGELGLLGIQIICKTLEDCKPIDFYEFPRTVTFRGLGHLPNKLKHCMKLFSDQGKVMLFTTQNEWNKKLKDIEEIKWSKPILIPWSRQKIIVTGIHMKKCFT